MNIHEAIEHARGVANKKYVQGMLFHSDLDDEELYYCIECAREHKQLAEWLEQLDQYMIIGTLDECREAVEKQIPKKPLYKQGTKYKWIDSVRERGRYYNVEKYSYRDACPNCKGNVLKEKFCCNCGQALDWSD